MALKISVWNISIMVTTKIIDVSWYNILYTQIINSIRINVLTPRILYLIGTFDTGVSFTPWNAHVRVWN